MSERMEATGGRGGGGGGGGAGGGEGIAHTPPQQEQQNLIESFRGITSSTPAEALFFLESHAWQLDAAVQSFFDADEEDPLPPAAAAPSPQPAAAAASRRRRRPRQLQEEEDDGQDDEDYVPPPADEPPPSRPATRLTAAAMASSSGSGRPSSKPSTGPGGRPAGGIRTLADLNRRSGYGSGSDTDEESDGPQEYYTGGEKSGMLVQDPSKGNPDIDSIFEQARQMGATQEPIEHFRPSSSSKSFTGTGRLLTGETVQATAEPPESVIHEVVFWTNGFTVNDGPLRRFDDPENAAFLESIKRSECPKELEPADRRTAVHVSLSRREQKCPEPVKRFNPFGGVGRTLGAGSSTSAAAPEAASASASASAAPTSAPPSAAGLYVDESLPSTSIQLRLADGTRMVARFNHHHTVGDIRGFIDASRPGAARSYQLQTVGFPPKQLADVTQTIEEAGLANSVVIQKL